MTLVKLETWYFKLKTQDLKLDFQLFISTDYQETSFLPRL